MYVPSTGKGSALAARNRGNMVTGNGLIKWALDNNIPTSQLLVGEMGIPASSNPHIDDNYDPGFTLALQQVFLELNQHNVHFAYWAGGEWNLDIMAYRNVDGSNKPVSYHTTAAAVLEKNLTGMHSVTAKRGVNLWGGDASDGGPSGGLNGGLYGQQYYFVSRESLEAVRQCGITFIRLPIRWERLQPTLKGSINNAYLDRIKAVLNDCEDLGIDVLLDIHNYGKYDTQAATNTTGSTNGVYKLGAQAPNNHNGAVVGGSMTDCFVDLWTKIAQALRVYPALWGYGLCNEPEGLPNGAADWQDASRRAVEAIRGVEQAAGAAQKRISVGGWFFSGIENWATLNGAPWLTSTIPAGQPLAGQQRNKDTLIIWEGHMYFDYDGTYTGSGSSFASLNQNAINAGFAAYDNGAGQQPEDLGITSQTGSRTVFVPGWADAGDWTVSQTLNTYNSNAVTFNQDFDGKKTMKVVTSDTSDEGGVRKTLLSDQVAREVTFEFGLPAGAALSPAIDFAIFHAWDQAYFQGNGANLIEIRVVGSGAGYKLRLTTPYENYVTQTGTTVLGLNELHKLKLVISDTSFKLYINDSATADITFNKTLTNTSIGGIALGKFYGTAYIGPMYYTGFSASQPGAQYDALPNGGLIALPTTTTTTTGGTTTTTTTAPTTTTTTTAPTTTTTTTVPPTTTTTTTLAGYHPRSATHPRETALATDTEPGAIRLFGAIGGTAMEPTVDYEQLENLPDLLTVAEVNALIAAVIDAAPSTLDTLNELAAALGDDPNFAATIMTALGSKAAASALATEIADRQAGDADLQDQVDDLPTTAETTAIAQAALNDAYGKLGDSGMGVVVHGAAAGAARPEGWKQVIWIGSVQPTNAATNDIWYNG